MRHAARATIILILISSVPGETTNTPNQEPAPGQKVLTADDFKQGRMISGSPLEDEIFLLRVNEKLPPFKFHLVPDAAAKDNLGSNNPSHKVGRIEISTTNPPALVQTIEVSTQASASVFRQYFEAIDINLDGYLDIAVTDDFGAKWGREEY